MRAVLNTWRFLWRHPLASRNRAAAFTRWLRWQIGSHILQGEAVVPFVQGSKLLVRRGMAGATGNIYTGLHEFEDMAFTLHFLRRDDLFVDAGANVGVYTVLAATTGARCVSIEPIPATHSDLVANILLNGFNDRVRTHQVGLGATPGVAEFTSDLDAMNHVVAANESARNRVQVQITTLDDLLRRDMPTLLKADVEGFETEVFDGGTETLASPNLLAMIVELNQSAKRYGAMEGDLIQKFEHFAFRPYVYMPFERELRACLNRKNWNSGNTLFIRNHQIVHERVRSAPRMSILGTQI